MGHAADANELLEVLGDELRAVVGDDPGRASGNCSRARWMIVSTSASVMLCADLPVDDGAAVAVEEAAEVVERAGDVDVRDVDVPVLVRPQRLHEARAFV